MLGASGGTVCLNDQSSLGRAVCYAPGTYRTVVSAVILGALQGSQRGALLGGVVEYLTAGTGLAEGRPTPVSGRIAVTPNPVRQGSAVRLNLPRGYSGPVAVFDACGRSVPVSFDSRHLTIVDLPAGSYVIRAAGQSVPFAVVR